MSLVTKFLLGLSVVSLLFFGGCAVSIVGINNNLVLQEEGIKAQYKQNQNNYDNMWKKFKEVSQVPDMYTSDMKKVYDGVMLGRYGKDGSKAMFQWIQEQNPQIDTSVYRQIQQVIEAGRNSFEMNQKTLLDKKRVYEVDLRQFPNNIVASALGFPKIDLDKYDIVTSNETQEVFETKKSDTIDLRE